MGRTLDVLALDLGASSGRAVLGRFDGERLRLSEVHRFPNRGVALPDGLHWNVLGLWTEVKEALARASRAPGVKLSGVGVDTWGLDFGLLDRDGRLLGNPHHYRDPRTDGMIDEAFRRVPRREVYSSTGVQFMQGNTLYQLLSMATSGSAVLDAAKTILTMPDLFNYWLTGRKASEFTNATTTQCYDPRRREWAGGMLKSMGLPTWIFAEIVPPGTVLGELSTKVAEEVGAGRLPVIAPACHDTGSAVAAVPAAGRDHAWISSGTWSIVGVDVPSPVIDERSLASELANEGGADGGFRLCKNVTGLWLVQECQRTWALQGRDHSYDELTRMAAEAPALRSIIDPDHPDFHKPGDMPERIRSFCRRTGQAVPDSEGTVVRAALEGIAMKYRLVLDGLENSLGRRLAPIHIVGGGARDALLSQLTADATGRQVVAGPVEATAAGNIVVQMVALGRVGNLSEGREIVRRSSDLTTYDPGDRAPWDEAYARLLAMVGDGRG